MMDGNLHLKYGRASCKKSSNVSRIIKGSRKEKELQEKNTKRSKSAIKCTYQVTSRFDAKTEI
jgi:hypothetical protein